MNERQRKIIVELSSKKMPYYTSQYLAEILRVSSRTVKSDMFYVDEEIKKYGAKIISKRNRGYAIDIKDTDIFSKYVMNLSIKENNDTENTGNEADMRLSVARKIISSDEGVFVENLEERYAYSKSVLSADLRWADDFFKIYGLEVNSSSRYGKKIEGKEEYRRMCMVELVAVHYHDTIYDKEDEEFLELFECDEKERKDIRHTFLKVLRESDYAMRDSNTQRFARYLVLALNRYNNGYRIILDEDTKKNLRTLKIRKLSEDIFKALGDKYKVLLDDEDELLFLTLYLICRMDLSDDEYDEDIVILAEPEISIVLPSIQKFFTDKGIILNDTENKILRNMTIISILNTRYHLGGMQKYDYFYESVYLSSPVLLYLSYELMDLFTYLFGARSSRTQLAMFGCFICGVLNHHQYPIKKMKLLIQSAFGRGNGKIIAANLMKKYPDFIEKAEAIDLYEYRRMEDEDYDGMLTDLKQMSTGDDLQGYNYALPAISYSNFVYSGQEENLFNNMLIGAYQFKDYLIDEKLIRKIDNYEFVSMRQSVQLFALLYAKNEEAIDKLVKSIVSRAYNKTPVFEDTVVLMLDRSLCKKDIFDIYSLKNSARYNNYKIENIIIISLDIKGIYEYKALEKILYVISKDKKERDYFIEDPLSSMEHIIRESLRI
ncbi:MAG: HTH domain-containing protein [Erysipelotrichaceae bacterium]|nr:HTH domain-containing protein [Erysipelotrichaceae bacterium]